MSADQSQHLNVLVNELSKKNPNEEIVKSKANHLGIPYNNDLIILMSEVLVYLSKSPEKKIALKDKMA